MQRAQKRAEAKDLDDSVSGKWVNDVVDTVSDTVSDVGGAITDGTGLVGDALSDAYNNAADQAGSEDVVFFGSFSLCASGF